MVNIKKLEKKLHDKAFPTKTKVTPSNYKKLGYQYYYKQGRRYFFTIETPDGREIIYDDNGKWYGEMS